MQISPSQPPTPLHLSPNPTQPASFASLVDPGLSAPPPERMLTASGLNHQHPTPQTQGELKQAFTDFVGQTMFGQMIKSMRSCQQPSAYFHGGRAEEIFQGQFDQVLAEQMSQASADSFADPMYELFMLKRQA